MSIEKDDVKKEPKKIDTNVKANDSQAEHASKLGIYNSARKASLFLMIGRGSDMTWNTREISYSTKKHAAGIVENGLASYSNKTLAFRRVVDAVSSGNSLGM